MEHGDRSLALLILCYRANQLDRWRHDALEIVDTLALNGIEHQLIDPANECHRQIAGERRIALSLATLAIDYVQDKSSNLFIHASPCRKPWWPKCQYLDKQRPHQHRILRQAIQVGRHGAFNLHVPVQGGINGIPQYLEGIQTGGLIERNQAIRLRAEVFIKRAPRYRRFSNDIGNRGISVALDRHRACHPFHQSLAVGCVGIRLCLENLSHVSRGLNGGFWYLTVPYIRISMLMAVRNRTNHIGANRMTHLVVRRLQIDLETPFERHWCGGDAFRTAFFNALSMSFPVGEQFFIDSVRNGYKALPPAIQERFETEVQGFIGQEATHRRIHSLFNGHLERQGLVNAWGPRAQERLKMMQGSDFRHWLAITAANEHFTALFADWILDHHEWLNCSDSRLKTMWMWHSAEEAEHKSTAFDLYQALGGNHDWRLKWMRRIAFVFVGDTLRQTIANLKQDGTLWKWDTWKSAGSFLFGTRGLIRHAYKPWREYNRRDFHPSQQDSPLSARWLEDNASVYSAVRAG